MSVWGFVIWWGIGVALICAIVINSAKDKHCERCGKTGPACWCQNAP